MILSGLNASRKVEDTYEFPLRCGFLNESYVALQDTTSINVATGGEAAEQDMAAGGLPLSTVDLFKAHFGLED